MDERRKILLATGAAFFLVVWSARFASYGAEFKKGSSLADRVDVDRPGSPEVNGTWTPIVTLRDTTDKFPGDKQIPRPRGGWWVSPIHANLLADGTILVTGWNRPEENFCRDHEGRRYGTSFRIDIKSLDVEQPATLGITPLDEQPRGKGDVLYCSGHAP